MSASEKTGRVPASGPTGSTGLEGRARFEAFLADLAASFVNVSLDDLDDQLGHALESLGIFFELDRVSVAQKVPDQDFFKVTHHWAAEGVRPLPIGHDTAAYPETTRRLLSGEYLYFADTDELPEDLASDPQFRALAKEIGVRSNISIPLRLGDRTIGALLMGKVRRRWDLSEELLSRLQLVGTVFAGSLLRKALELESERHRAELARFGRTAALGELAAALAHELNQPLSAALTTGQAAIRLIERGMLTLEEVEKILRDITNEHLRAREIMRRLRNLYTRDDIERSPTDTNEIVRGVRRVVQSEFLRRGVPLRLELTEGLPTILADGIQLSQVLVVLAVNGLDAMEEGPEGRGLTIRTLLSAPVAPREEAVAEEGDVAERKVVITVEDTGPGIAPMDRENVFEPFVSTKEGGLGMGLAIARRIVKAHGGEITAHGGENGGALFRVVLPIARP